MKKIFEEVVWYALGRKGNVHKHKHGYLHENKNLTKVQNFLSTIHDGDELYKKLYDELFEGSRKLRKDKRK